MDSAERATRISQAVSETLNCLGILLCGPALRKHGPDVHKMLEHWEQEHAPTIRELGSDGHPGLHSVVERLASNIRAGVDVNAPEQLAAIRLAVREFMMVLGVPLPSVSPAESVICELHGAECPMLEVAPA